MANTALHVYAFKAGYSQQREPRVPANASNLHSILLCQQCSICCSVDLHALSTGVPQRRLVVKNRCVWADQHDRKAAAVKRPEQAMAVCPRNNLVPNVQLNVLVCQRRLLMVELARVRLARRPVQGSAP